MGTVPVKGSEWKNIFVWISVGSGIFLLRSISWIYNLTRCLCSVFLLQSCCVMLHLLLVTFVCVAVRFPTETSFIFLQSPPRSQLNFLPSAAFAIPFTSSLSLICKWTEDPVYWILRYQLTCCCYAECSIVLVARFLIASSVWISKWSRAAP